MASPGPSAPRDAPSRQMTGSEQELLQSLDGLSLSTSPATLSQSPSRFPSPLKSSGDLPPPSPSGRRPSWTPLTKSHSHGGASATSSHSRSGTPTLLRKASTTSLHSSNGVTPHRAPSRKSSASNLRSPAPPPPEFVPKPAPTIPAVASAYFKKELELLHDATKQHNAETLVVLHDACYGHRFSRPRATKGHLFSIVERPERLQASVLGVAMAYVRLGERHSDGKFPIHPDLDPSTLPSVPFHIHKTSRMVPLTDPVVTNVHGTKWMEELKIMCESADVKLALKGSELQRPDMDRGPDSEAPQKLHEGDLYLCAESQGAFEGALGAVCEAVDAIFSPSSHKRAFVAVRPPGHHCSASYPSGFCWVNNVHVGIMHGILKHGLTHAAIIDFDLHHGDGSQAITWQHNTRRLVKNAAAWKKTSIGYFSVHDINSFPCEYGDEEKVRNASVCIDNAHGQSIWNVHLQEWKTEVEFWSLYQSRYSILLEKTRKYCKLQTERYRALGQEPKGIIFLSAGFDASEYETEGMQRHKVNVPTEFYARLTRDVVKIASEEGLGVGGRVISVLEGGYSDRALYSGVLSHLGGLATTESINPKDEITPGLGQEMSNRIAKLGRRRSTLTEQDIMALKVPGFPYDPAWWSRSELDRFDSYIAPTPQEPKKPRTTVPPTYSSPTHASVARETDFAKTRRSLSGMNGVNGTQAMAYRVPTPPPPDVPWPAAVQELSKLLIPSDRPTSSFTYEQLNAEAKARRERQAAAISLEAANKPPATPSRAPTRMSLRERKPVKGYSELDDEDLEKGRRKTVGGTTQTRQPSRRLSASSSITTATQASSDPPSYLSVGSDSHDGQADPSVNVQSSLPPVLNVKKTRATPRSSPAKPRARKPKDTAPGGTPGPRQQVPPLPRVPSGSAISSKSKLPISGPSSAAPMPAAPASARAPRTKPASTKDDLDNITNGMKRIKINVLTKEKKEERARAQAQKKADVGLKVESSPAPTEPQSTTEQPEPVKQSTTPVLDENPVTPGLNGPGEDILSVADTPQVPFSAPPATLRVYEPEELSESSTARATPDYLHAYNPGSSPSPLVQGEGFEMSSPVEATTPVGEPDLFVPYEPDGPPATTVPLSGPIQILEPNMGTPAPPDRRVHEQFDAPSPSLIKLPHLQKMGHQFTATSNIPFAPRFPSKSSFTVEEQTPNQSDPVIKVEDESSNI